MWLQQLEETGVDLSGGPDPESATKQLSEAGRMQPPPPDTHTHNTHCPASVGLRVPGCGPREPTTTTTTSTTHPVSDPPSQ